MSTTPLLSVIIPFYNRADVITATLDSILNQTFRDFELICVDDGSTDAVPQILTAYAQKDPRMQIIRQQHTNAGAARNVGYEQSRGDYVFFLDSDDIFAPNYFATMLETIQEQASDLVICRVQEFDHHRQQINRVWEFRNVNLTANATTISRQDFLPAMFTITYPVVWNRLFKRALIEQNHLRFQSIIRNNDVYFAYYYLFKCQKITLLDQILVTYRVQDQRSISNMEQLGTTYCQAMDYFRAQLTPDEFALILTPYYQRYLQVTCSHIQNTTPDNGRIIFQHLRKIFPLLPTTILAQLTAKQKVCWQCLQQNDFQRLRKYLSKSQ